MMNISNVARIEIRRIDTLHVDGTGPYYMTMVITQTDGTTHDVSLTSDCIESLNIHLDSTDAEGREEAPEVIVHTFATL